VDSNLQPEQIVEKHNRRQRLLPVPVLASIIPLGKKKSKIPITFTTTSVTAKNLPTDVRSKHLPVG
jgi:hypothetical protein